MPVPLVKTETHLYNPNQALLTLGITAYFPPTHLWRQHITIMTLWSITIYNLLNVWLHIRPTRVAPMGNAPGRLAIRLLNDWATQRAINSPLTAISEWGCKFWKITVNCCVRVLSTVVWQARLLSWLAENSVVAGCQFCDSTVKCWVMSNPKYQLIARVEWEHVMLLSRDSDKEFKWQEPTQTQASQAIASFFGALFCKRTMSEDARKTDGWHMRLSFHNCPSSWILSQLWSIEVDLDNISSAQHMCTTQFSDCTTLPKKHCAQVENVSCTTGISQWPKIKNKFSIGFQNPQTKKRAAQANSAFDTG